MKSSPSICRYVVSAKLTVKISSIFVAFLENMDFTKAKEQLMSYCLIYILRTAHMTGKRPTVLQAGCNLASNSVKLSVGAFGVKRTRQNMQTWTALHTGTTGCRQAPLGWPRAYMHAPSATWSPSGQPRRRAFNSYVALRTPRARIGVHSCAQTPSLVLARITPDTLCQT